MFTVKALKRVGDSRVIPRLKEIFESEGFKFYKGRGNFERTIDGVTQIISVGGLSTDSYETDGEKYFVGIFVLSTKVELTAFEKWTTSELDSKQNISKKINSYNYYITIPYEDFKYEDFAYGIKPNRYTKRHWKDEVVDRYNGVHYPIETVGTDLKSMLFDLSEWSEYEKIYDDRPEQHVLSYDYLRCFMGKKDEIKPVFIAQYNEAFDAYKLADGAQDKQNKRYTINVWAKRIEELFDEKLDVPEPEAPFKLLPTQNEYLAITKEHHFAEVLRMDITLLDVQNVYLNNVGDFLLNPLNGSLSVFDKKGERLLEWKNGFWDAYNHREHNSKFVLEGTNWFAQGTTIIKENGQVLELEVPPDHPPDFVKLRVQDLKYDLKEKEFLLLLYSYKSDKSFLLTYNEDGKIKAAKTISTTIPALSILLKTKRIVAQDWEKRITTIWDFEGKMLNEFSSTSKNYLTAISFDESYAVTYSFNNSSNLFDFKKGAKKSLKPHPTSKTYKAAFFPLHWNNYGIKQIAFSPDNKYAVAGGYSGKYVVWTLPAARMIELIPSANVLEKLSWELVNREGGEEVSRETEYPYLAEFEGKEYLKNRGNDINCISYLNNGEYFLTHTEKIVMVWDKYFNNINYFDNTANLEDINEHFTVRREGNILVLFKRVAKPDETKDTVFVYQKPKSKPLIPEEPIFKSRHNTTKVAVEPLEVQQPLEIPTPPPIERQEKEPSKPKLSFWQKLFGK